MLQGLNGGSWAENLAREVKTTIKEKKKPETLLFKREEKTRNILKRKEAGVGKASGLHRMDCNRD